MSTLDVIQNWPPPGFTERDTAIERWSEGRQVTGIFRGFSENDVGKLLKLEIDRKPLTFGCPAALLRILTALAVKDGETVSIFCVGKTAPSRQGPNTAWVFRVAMEDGADGDIPF